MSQGPPEPLPPTLLIGVGNRDRGDDAVGPIIGDGVRQLGIPGLRTAVLESAVVDLSSHWSPDDRVVVVDAARPDGHPGRVTEIDAIAGGLGVPTSTSTHSIDLSGAVELARVLDRLPAELTVLAVEGESFEFGASLSPRVESSVRALVARFEGHRRQRQD